MSSQTNSILQSLDGKHIDSYYAATANPLTTFDSLENDLTTDVCIIGGGFTGLSTALHLAEQGVEVTLLEGERIGWGASGRNGGHVGTGQRVGQDKLEKNFGLETAKQFWQYGLEAVDTVRELIEKHKIECDLKEGIIHVGAKASDVAWMKEDVSHLNKTYGYDDMRFVEQDEVREMVGSERFHCGQLDSASCHLHPLNYARGLANAAVKAGATLFERSRVIEFTPDAEPGLHHVRTDRAVVKAKRIVLACNGYLDKLVPSMAGKIMPINNFVLATEPLSEELARDLIRDDLAVQDSLFVINYWKLSGDNRLLFGGGENYTHRFAKDIKSFVRKYMLRIYPQLESTKIDYGWGGTLAVTMNRMPHFGTLSENIYFAQGYSGHGVPTATFAGKLLGEALTGKPERFEAFAKLPTPTFPGGTLLRWPGLVVGMLYYTLLDKL